MKKSLDELAAIERMISDEYGQSAVINPKGAEWTEEKIENFKKDVSRAVEKHKNKKNKMLKEHKNTCDRCETFSFRTKDDIYLIKFGCCEKCYILHIEGRQ